MRDFFGVQSMVTPCLSSFLGNLKAMRWKVCSITLPLVIRARDTVLVSLRAESLWWYPQVDSGVHERRSLVGDHLLHGLTVGLRDLLLVFILVLGDPHLPTDPCTAHDWIPTGNVICSSSHCCCLCLQDWSRILRLVRTLHS